MNLAQPWGLLALLALVPLVAVYVLRRRHRPHLVSALFLWRGLVERTAGGRRWERLSREASLILEALAVVVASLLLAQVSCVDGSASHEAFVVDGSLSLSARTSEGGTVSDRLRRAVRAQAVRARRVTVVESGPRPVVRAGPFASPEAVEAAMAAWAPGGPDHDPGPALALARRLAPRGRVTFFTDALPSPGSDVPEDVDVVALGEPADNVGLLFARRADAEGRAAVTLGIANFGRSEARFEVAFAPRGGRPERAGVAIAPGATAVISRTLPAAEAIDVALPEDALEADGHATLLAPRPRQVGVGIAAGLPESVVRSVRRLVGALPEARLVPADPDLWVGPRRAAPGLSIEAPGQRRAFVAPFVVDRAHPLLGDVHFAGVVWTAGDDPPGQPLVSAGEAVLVSEDELGAVHVNVDLERSTVQRTPAWPILLSNVVRRCRARTLGFAKAQAQLGEVVSVVVDQGSDWVVDGPRGPLRLAGDGALFEEPLSAAGRYLLRRDGQPFDTLVVHAFAPRESDLRGRASGRREAAERTAPGGGPAPSAAGWLLPLLLGVVLADFVLTAQGLPARGRRA